MQKTTEGLGYRQISKTAAVLCLDSNLTKLLEIITTSAKNYYYSLCIFYMFFKCVSTATRLFLFHIMFGTY